jgi:hypothetical protein
MTCTNQRQHTPLGDDALHQNLDLAAAFLVREQTRFHDTRIVEHQQIAGLQQPGQIGEIQVMQFTSGTIEVQ